MHKLEIRQFNTLDTTGDGKDKWRQVSVNLELAYIPQIGSFFFCIPYLHGKVREVRHKHTLISNEDFHEVILDRFGDWNSFPPNINWDDLPENVTAGGIRLNSPDGPFID